VRSGSQILVNRWTTDDTGAVTDSSLYALSGTTLKLVAAGTGAGEAVAADSKRVALLRPDGTIALYSTTGTPLFSVTPEAQAEKVALSGRNLVALEPGGTLALYDARTGSLRQTFTLHGNPDVLLQRALAVQGNVAVYSTPVRNNGTLVRESAIRALDLANGKDREVGRLRGQITVAAINSTGLVYAADGLGAFGPSKLVFVPFERVAAAVS
jgi:hypothetical protein